RGIQFGPTVQSFRGRFVAPSVRGVAYDHTAMASREERVAHNEAASREINEGIEGGHEGAPPDRYIRIVCECGQESCERLIAITVPEYERVRADPRQFAVVREHVMADVERAVDETDRFDVVAKREGTPAEVATEEDPRN